MTLQDIPRTFTSSLDTIALKAQDAHRPVSVGLIGLTGKMGQLIALALDQHPTWVLGPSFGRGVCTHHQDKLVPHIQTVFQENDMVVDFSDPQLAPCIAEALETYPKPLILGTTGIQNCMQVFAKSAMHAPVIIAPNTAWGAFIQRVIARQLAAALGPIFDVDVVDIHHRDKKDTPSGTALALAHAVQEVYQDTSGCKWHLTQSTSPRQAHTISVTGLRTGKCPGQHTLMMTSPDEQITLTYTAFSKKPYVDGVLKLLAWMHTHQPAPGCYTLEDVWPHR
jgi:4-hydroxy-tetrahydrodipicolinate reductase